MVGIVERRTARLVRVIGNNIPTATAFLVVVVSGCGVSPTAFQTGVPNSYCDDFLRFAHLCASWATGGFLVCLCITVTTGFLAAQLSNRDGGTFWAKNQSTFLFVGAVLFGILGAYLHARADAASRAASDIEQGMTNRDPGKRYDLCLVAASRWDGSLSQSLDAASAAVSKSDTSGASQLAEAAGKAGEARAKFLKVTEEHDEILRAILNTLDKTVPAGRKQVRTEIDQARTRLDEGRGAIGDVKTLIEDESEMVVKAKKMLRTPDDNGGSADSKAAVPSKPKPM
jgi:hypothetical protein